MARYTFFLAYQSELERLDPGLGRRAQATADVDGDGISTRRPRCGHRWPRGDADRTPLGWGIPDAFRARTTVAVPATAYRRGYCVWLTEAIPSPATIAAARRLRTRAADRGCAPPASSPRARARGEEADHADEGQDQGEGRHDRRQDVTLSVKTKKTAKIRFDVVSGTQVVARAKPPQGQGREEAEAQEAHPGCSTGFPSGDTLKLRITARIGKKTARGQIRSERSSSRPARPARPARPGRPGPPPVPPPARCGLQRRGRHRRRHHPGLPGEGGLRPHVLPPRVRSAPGSATLLLPRGQDEARRERPCEGQHRRGRRDRRRQALRPHRHAGVGELPDRRPVRPVQQGHGHRRPLRRRGGLPLEDVPEQPRHRR